jgi:hypothetical protein
MTARVVVATADTEPGEATDRLLLLVDWMRRRGVDVEIVSLGDGSALRRFRACAPTTVVDELRRRGPARVPYLLGLHRATAGIKSARLRRWLARRRDATFFVHDPLAASLLRYMTEPPSRVVAGLPDADATLSSVRPEDLRSLQPAVGWVVTTATQVDQVTSELGAPAEVLGSMVDRAALPPVRAGEDPATVVVLVSADLWNQPDHAVELTWQLLERRPATRVRWLVQGREATWLCRHDLQHTGLGDAVTLWSSDHPDALDDCAVLVRTGHRPERDDLLVAASLAGVPLLDWAGDELLGPPTVGPLDVEHAVERIVVLVDDPAAAASAGAAMIEHLAEVDLDRLGNAVLGMLTGDTG